MTRRYHGPAYYLFLPFFLIFFAVPYLFDVAYCEELYGTPLSQAALIDGEKVDPYEGAPAPHTVDWDTSFQGICLVPDGVARPSLPTGQPSDLHRPPQVVARPPPVI